MNSSTTNFDVSPRRAVRYLLWFFGTAMVLSICAWVVVRPIAPQFTGNASFDQKLLYLREHPPKSGPIGLVVGSSMALNNVDTDVLASSLDRPFLNLGVWGLGTAEAGRIADQFDRLYGASEIILVAQFFEMKEEPAERFAIPDAALHEYLKGNAWLADIEYRDFYESLRMRSRWARSFENQHRYTSLKFSETGAAPLLIRPDQSDPSRWNPPQPFSVECKDCMREIESMCVAFREKNIPFSVVMPPLTQWIGEHREDVRAAYADRRTRLAAVLKRCGAPLFDAAKWAKFDDACFADFAHLNATGMRRMTELFLHWREKKLTETPISINCAED